MEDCVTTSYVKFLQVEYWSTFHYKNPVNANKFDVVLFDRKVYVSEKLIHGIVKVLHYL